MQYLNNSEEIIFINNNLLILKEVKDILRELRGKIFVKANKSY